MQINSLYELTTLVRRLQKQMDDLLMNPQISDARRGPLETEEHQHDVITERWQFDDGFIDLSASGLQVLADSAPIPTTERMVPVSHTGAAVDITMQAGTYTNQRVTVVNKGTGDVTMAVAGTSRVANGTACVIPENEAADFVWIHADTLWYPMRS